jgi:hypothetical protein
LLPAMPPHCGQFSFSSKEKEMPFQPGQSGNPAGRPRGARNKATVLFEELLEGNGEAVIRKIIEQAKEGEGKALGWLMGILIPKRKGVPIEVDLPRLEGAEDAPPVIAAILAAVGAGDVTPDEGISLTRLVEAYLRAKEKVVKLAHRAGRERAVEAAAAKTREPKERNARPGEQAPVALYSVVQGDPPSQAGEPSRNSPAPELLHALLRGQTGTSLPRLRHEALSTTCPLARSAGTATAAVPPLFLSGVSPGASGRVQAAA